MKSFFKKYDKFKIISLVLIVLAVLTWIIPAGAFTSGVLTSTTGGASAELTRIGIVNFMLGGVNSIYNYSLQIVFVLIIGALYGVLSQVEGYKVLVSKIANSLKGKEVMFALVTSFIMALMSSVLTNTLMLLVFIPFIINIALKMKLDKMSAFLITFGSILIGLVGVTFGSDGFLGFLYYMSSLVSGITIDMHLLVRFGILALAYILYSFFTMQHVKKVLAAKKLDEEDTKDLFEVEESKAKKVNIWPLAISFIIVAILVILGFVDWKANFGIEMFDNFHTWFMGLTVGGHKIFTYLLSDYAAAFGYWDLIHIIVILLIVLGINALIYGVKFDQLIESALNGIKKIAKPLLIMILVYTVFIFMYWSPIMPQIAEWIHGANESLNPFLAMISGTLSGILNVNFSYAGYTIGSYFSAYSLADGQLVTTIYAVMNGFASLIAPTSVILMIGLTYLNIPYTKWFKYIWKFLLGLLVCLIVIFALMAYL